MKKQQAAEQKKLRLEQKKKTKITIEDYPEFKKEQQNIC
jgi:hypothetical protein